MGYVTELASTRVPTSLDELRAERIATDELTIGYRISCSCGGTRGTITSEFDPSIDFWLDPIIFTCVDCTKAATFFDTGRHGYDGVLNGGSSYQQRTREELVTCPDCRETGHELLGHYTYSFPREEIESEWTNQERAQLPDLFSSVEFELTCGACRSKSWLGAFECA